MIRTSRLTRTDQKCGVLGIMQLVELQSRLGRIQLKVESRGLRGLLLVAGQLVEAVCEGVGDSELHFMASGEPRWNVTLTCLARSC